MRIENILILKPFSSALSVLRVLGLATLLVFTACDDDDPVNVDPEEKALYSDGVFVLSEGAFETGNASVSFIDHKTDEVAGKLFKEANGSEIVLGDVLMDMVSVDTLSFFILNGSGNVKVVNNKNFAYVDEITKGIDNPRYATVYDGMIYVTQWGNGGEVLTIDPTTLLVAGSVAVGAGPDEIVNINDKLWVVNSGGYGQDNTISVIDTERGSVTNTIEVADCPKKVVEDVNGNVWAICSGYVKDYETGETTVPGLVRINGDSEEVVQTFDLPASDYGHPSRIAISSDKSSVYFANAYGVSGVWKMAVDANQVPDEPWLNELPYNMGVNSQTGEIYLGIAPNFTDPGYVTVYDANGEKDSRQS
jgi:hypothetical protein